MAVKSSDDFLKIVEKSNLLAPEQLAEAHESVQPGDNARAVARWLVKRSRLTRWQAQQLLAGRSKLYLGKYKILETLGQGGMGAVLKAEQPALNRIVALKIMSKELLQDATAATRFQREIRSVAALNHPNIVIAYDADCVGDRYFLVMEYVDGKDLKAWIREYGVLPLDWSCECIRQAALGLQHAHERGMVHRDIKPSNLLVSADDKTSLPQVKILDLGLARLASESKTDGTITHTGQIMGSPDYIAPEQAQKAQDADTRADIFSLGCTLFKLVTGRVPFQGNTVMEKLMARATQDAPPMSRLRPEVPAGLDRIVAKMLQRDPAMRFQTPGEVAQALASPDESPVVGSDTGFLQQPVVNLHDGAIQEEADTTLNDFNDYLANRASEETPFARRQSPWQKHRKWLVVGGVVVTVLCVQALFSLRGALDGGSSKPKGKQAVQKQKQDGKTSAKPTTGNGNGDGAGSTANDPETRIAQWVLKSGGDVTVLLDQERRSIKQAGDLPRRSFQIVEIDLQGNQQIQQSELELLGELDLLESLNLNGSAVSDPQLQQLASLTELSSLNLGSTLITDKGLRHLSQLQQLSDLNLRFTTVSDTGLKSLTAIKGLSSLDLDGTDVRDAGLQHLRHLKKLKSLKLRYTYLSKQGIEALRGALPNCDIRY